MQGIYQKLNNFLEADPEPIHPIRNIANNVMQYGEELKKKFKTKMDGSRNLNSEQKSNQSRSPINKRHSIFGNDDQRQKVGTHSVKRIPPKLAINTTKPIQVVSGKRIFNEFRTHFNDDFNKLQSIRPDNQWHRQVMTETESNDEKIPTKNTRNNIFPQCAPVPHSQRDLPPLPHSQRQSSQQNYSRTESQKSLQGDIADFENDVDGNCAITIIKEKSYAFFNKTLFLIEQEDEQTVEPLYYEENAEAKICQILISKLGSKPDLQKQTALDEKLQKKNMIIQGKIKAQAQSNQHLVNKSFVLTDGLAFRLNQCYTRIRESRKLIKAARTDITILGMKIQRRLKEQKEKEQKIFFLQKFKERYNMIFQLIRELQQDNKFTINQQAWNMDQIKQAIQKVQRGLQDIQEQRFMNQFICFKDIKQTIDQSYNTMLMNSHTYFTQNMIASFVIYDKQQSVLNSTLLQMSERLQQLQNDTNQYQINLFVILKKQLRGIYNKKNPPHKHLKELNSLLEYLRAFALGFYEFSYGLTHATIFFSKNRNSKLISSLWNQVQACKTQIWDYAQDKLCKIQKNTKLSDEVNNSEINNYLVLMKVIIQVGVEVSGGSSSLKLVEQGERMLHKMIQIVGLSVSRNIVSQNFPFQRTCRLNYPQLIEQQEQPKILSTLLMPNEVLQQIQEVPKDPEESRGPMPTQLSILQQIQRLQSLAEGIPSMCLECVQHAMNSYELILYVHLYQKTKYQQLMRLTQTSSKLTGLDELVQVHSLFIFQREHENLILMIYRAKDTLIQINLDPKAIKPLDLERSAIAGIMESLKEWFGSICNDKAYWMQLVARSADSMKELESMLLQQSVRLSNDPKWSDVILQEFRTLKQSLNATQMSMHGNIMIQQIAEQFTPLIQSNPKISSEVLRVLNEIVKQITISQCSQFTLQYKRLLEQKMIENTNLLVLKNPHFPLSIGIHFCDTKNSSFINQLMKEYRSYIDTNS